MSNFVITDTSKFSMLEVEYCYDSKYDIVEGDVLVNEEDDVNDEVDEYEGDEFESQNDNDVYQQQQFQFMESIISTTTYNDTCNLSKLERRKKQCNGDVTLTYGEVIYDSFREVILLILNEHGGITKGAKVYDLGSGRGRASFIMTLLVNEFYEATDYLHSCTGIEIVDCLHAMSLDALESWNQNYKSYLLQSGRAIGSIPKDSAIQFIHGSIIDLNCVNWTDGELVFVNSTCFTGIPQC